MSQELDFDGDGPSIKYRKRYGKFWSAGDVKGQKKRYRAKKSAKRRQNIAILDLETDPFDDAGIAPVHPFLAVVYSDQFPTIIIWDNDWKSLVEKLYAELEALDEPFIIYAHNGGRFDYMFLLHLIQGHAKFKGRSLMSAKFGKHELRDSLHIIPESLKNANRKISFDYTKMRKDKRERYRQEITHYCIEDCVATFEVVRAFVDKFGLPITIGQAAMSELKKEYSFKRLTERTDWYMRQWFFGGRVECLGKTGHYKEPLKLYDVNSMYPSVMAYMKHPTGNEFYVGDRVTRKTAFIHLECDNKGALISRGEDGTLTTGKTRGEFFTTIYEYRAAHELGLIKNILIIKTIDFDEWQDFRGVIVRLYMEREKLKAMIAAEPNHANLKALKQEATFIKYLLNNIYGKFAQNPRKFKDYWLTLPDERPPIDWLYKGVDFEAKRNDELPDGLSDVERMDYVKRLRSLPTETTNAYWIWSIPSGDWRFNNVCTAATITGGARAKLLRAIHASERPLYCDTDSLVCSGIRDTSLHIHASELGAWKCETDINEFIVAGKKLYGFHTPEFDGITKRDDLFVGEQIRSKGNQGVTWDELLAIVGGQVISKTLKAPTITRAQTQHYMTRELRMTG